MSGAGRSRSPADRGPDLASVTVAVPVLDEEANIGACLDSVAAQSYGRVAQVLVVDGGSTDATRALAAARPGVQVLDNPRRIQSAALNVALAHATGEVFVRVDGHCRIFPDYVERSVEALQRTGAAMVGGPMRPDADGWLQRGIAAAMASPLGAGPARFHAGGSSGWVDTVYLGAFPTELARRLGGYAEDVGVNEDAELAIRMRPHGGVWLDDAIRSTYVPRTRLRAVARQFYRYGRSRAATVRRHPGSLAARQLAAPALVVAACTPWRRRVFTLYGAAVAAAGARQLARDPQGAPGLVLALPAMHIPWGAGFVLGLVVPPLKGVPTMSTTRTLQGLAGMLWRGPRTNSQFGEDVFVARFFAGSPAGTWLDVGAFHPRIASNTARLRRRGWTGINVDADPVKMRLFRWFRASERNVCAAVAGPAAGHALLRRRARSSYGSMDRVETTAGPGGLPTRTVAEVLAETDPERVDFVSIDVEGLEDEVLAGFPFDRYTPELFCVEVLDTTLEGVRGSAVSDRMARHGYRIVGWFPPSVFFARHPLALDGG